MFCFSDLKAIGIEVTLHINKLENGIRTLKRHLSTCTSTPGSSLRNSIASSVVVDTEPREATLVWNHIQTISLRRWKAKDRGEEDVQWDFFLFENLLVNLFYWCLDVTIKWFAFILRYLYFWSLVAYAFSILSLLRFC